MNQAIDYIKLFNFTIIIKLQSLMLMSTIVNIFQPKIPDTLKLNNIGLGLVGMRKLSPNGNNFISIRGS